MTTSRSDEGSSEKITERRIAFGTWILLMLIRGYRRFISPLLGEHCRFVPTCSVYATEALRRHGFFRGLWLSSRRLLRCNPFHPGGFDPVPPDGKRKEHETGDSTL